MEIQKNKLENFINNDNIPNLLKYDDHDKLVNTICNIEGFDIKTASKFVNGLFKFKLYLRKLPMIVFKEKTKKGNLFVELHLR